MARKDVLKGLLSGAVPGQGATPGPSPVPNPGPNLTPAYAPNPNPAPARPSRGAIGAVSQSIADLKARAVIDLDPELIDAGGMQDRLYPDDDGEDASLLRSIAEYGQQVPVLVRPHPETAGRYQIVYGRRRVRALRELGQPVKALIRDLDDTALIMAQGQENSARRDLSFIEKVVFAQRLDDAGYSRKTICDALSVDKTLISRMLSISERIPIELIERIGPAPGIGRERWITLAEMMEVDPASADELPEMVLLLAGGSASENRFEAAIGYLRRNAGHLAAASFAAASSNPTNAANTGPRKARLRGSDGMTLGEAVYGQEMVNLRFKKIRSRGFEDWLIASLPDLHRQWEEGPDTPNPPDDKTP